MIDALDKMSSTWRSQGTYVEYLEEPRRLALREGILDRVTIMESCSTAEQMSFAQSASDEHFGTVPLEAMAAHKPVMACNSEDPTDTIDMGPEDFCWGMAELIPYPEMAEKIGEVAHQLTSMS
ncbi:hypothetical protein Ancab_025591 [Ancistrocladus abbreviatus]